MNVRFVSPAGKTDLSTLRVGMEYIFFVSSICRFPNILLPTLLVTWLCLHVDLKHQEIIFLKVFHMFFPNYGYKNNNIDAIL